MPRKLTSPLKYYGGKGFLLNKLLPMIPEHKTYVEVFAGSAKLFFAKPVSQIEVINDLDLGVTNFYQVVQDENKFQKLFNLLSLTPYSRGEFFRCRDTWKDAPDDVHRAHRWFITMRMSYAAAGKSFSFSKTSTSRGMAQCVSAYLSAVNRLPEIHERLRGRVQFDQGDFRKIIKRYDASDTFFYLDPPYVHSTRKTTNDYAHEMADQDHKDLVQILLEIKGKAILSGYANPIYSPLEDAGWERHEFSVPCTAPACSSTNGSQPNGSVKKRQSRTEVVWIKR